jgi:serine/threonine protein kinase
VAEDERLGRQVALKVVRAAYSGSEGRERLWREARAAAATSRPNICQLYAIEEQDDTLFLVMELLEVESLATRLEHGPLPVSVAADIALQMLAALQALHRRGLVHRDVKPSNVFLAATLGVKLLDFGLVRTLEADDGAGETMANLTGGALVGTPRYVAPESLDGRRADARGDLFAAGAVLYEMIAGRPAFGGASIPDILQRLPTSTRPCWAGRRVSRRSVASSIARSS